MRHFDGKRAEQNLGFFEEWCIKDTTPCLLVILEDEDWGNLFAGIGIVKK